MRRALLLCALLVAPVLAGCLEGESDIVLTAYVNGLTVEPERIVTFVLLVENRAAFRMDAPASVERAPPGWNVSVERESLDIAGSGTSTLFVNATPTRDAAHGFARLTVRVGDATTDLFTRVVAETPDAPEARPGIGVRVFTVGFWDNGTTFYYNWKEVHDRDGVPKHDLSGGSAPPAFDPLKVYVGGRRGERPPEPYNASGYFTVIQGFDHALRGMRAGETHATRIAPEFAYTQPGNEDHALYGDALNFMILVTHVDELPPQDEGPLPVCPPPVC